ncbi:unnamed protein product [Rotaria magnacalcarata]|uniref:Uncharacterized protein n=1 Tax=Rotaria magnacalcarata TaxID=392030 RepID=A0A817A7Q1_9BILA|nr:unnamed protein product [Rotaria magnacalcarata]CAF1576503.1 unnamed protein product [Rotaria magnacalcarata]CAF2258263.1 unnamed protein product [Rotaria magnacalcarata]CAF3917734.1 unnamed protein product [Rotaria magnacalcarata]CAF3918479.1 unnamed protein product [Rotaria magnacalcarata]
MHGIFACLILNAVTLLSYTLPFGSQIGLCMTCFMTYSVYSLNFSNLFPQQSEYLMMITLFFLLSICWTLISMIWFIICNHLISKVEMPKPLYAFCGQLQRVLFYCFEPPKQDEKKTKRLDTVVENGGISKPVEEQNTNKISDSKMKCISCQKLFASCFPSCNRVESSEKNQNIKIEDMEQIRNDSNDVTTTETITSTSTNEIVEQEKAKYNFCNRFESCQVEFDKDKANGEK